jgi:beta-hydroxylase
LNQVFGYVYHFRLLAKRVKTWNKTVYYMLKWPLLGAVTYLIFSI